MMIGDTMRVFRRRVPIVGEVYQVCIIRGDDVIPIGPFGDDIDELRDLQKQMLEACDKPVKCSHDRLNEEGICRSCGADCRGIGS